MWTGSFWKQAAERAIKSAAQVGATALGVDLSNLVGGFNLRTTLILMGGALVASLLTSVATSGVGESDSPSAVSLRK